MELSRQVPECQDTGSMPVFAALFAAKRAIWTRIVPVVATRSLAKDPRRACGWAGTQGTRYIAAFRPLLAILMSARSASFTDAAGTSIN
jgi:hypothetical protein